MLTRPRGVAIAIAAGVLVMFAVWVMLQWGHPMTTINVGNIGSIGFSAFAMGGAVVAAWRGHGPQRIAWLCLAVGLAGWVVGDLVWAYYYLTSHSVPPSPSLADAAYLLLPVCVVVSALLAPRRGSRASIRLLLEGVIVSTSLFLVAWPVGLRSLYEASGLSAYAFAISVAYPLADLVMIVMIAVVLAKTPKGRRLSPALLTAGLVTVGATSCLAVFANAHPGFDKQALVLGWAIGTFFVGAAGLTSKPTTATEVVPTNSPSRIVLWLPYLPVPFAVAVGARDIWPFVITGPILVVGFLLFLAALLRQLTLLAENRRLLVTVAEIALRDPLTDLGNRTLFGDRLAHAMQLRLRRAAPVAVLLLDLDDFKLVNDSLGHAAGDVLLRSVGERIQGSLRDGDTVARLGGDEFAVLIEDDPLSTRAVAESVVTAFDQPFVVDGREVFVRPSVGLAVAPAVGEEDLTADDLFRRADLAMYSAKRAQFRGVRVFTSGMRLDATELHGVDRMQLLGDLRHAIDNDDLALVYQPKFNLSTGAVVGVEALIRWPHPTLGTLGPADFLPLVRQNGLMDAVTALVLARAVGDAAGWYAKGIEVPVAINLSATSLDDELLPDRLLSVLAEHGMPADSLSVEITEDLLLASIDRTRIVLDRLRQNGIRVAIDDFGSGYAAMTYLRELPIDEIKLDRQFVTPIVQDPRAAAIVESVIELADTFGICCVAEGVEDKATAERLKEYGCGYAQGHYFSPPVPAQAISLGVWGSQPATARPSSA